MNKFFAVFAILILSAFTNTNIGFAQELNESETVGLLYEISGNDLQTPSYLFGTVHIVCPIDMLPMETLRGYIAKTDRLILEMNLDDQAEVKAIQDHIFLPKGTTLKKLLKPVEFAIVDKFFKENLGVSVNDLAHIKPVFLSTMLLSNPKFTGCNNSTSYEETLLGFAKTNKKSISGLEDSATQIQLISDSNYTKQAVELYKFVSNEEKSINTISQLVVTYRTQDSEKLYEFVAKEMENDKDTKNRLLDDRNLDWIPKIEKAIKERSSFIAVGGGHLGGQNGVVKLLRAKGYLVTAIKL